MTKQSVDIAASRKSIVKVSGRKSTRNPVFTRLLRWAPLLPGTQRNLISQSTGGSSDADREDL